jgi:PAS domain S-box-containing protein
MAMLGERLVGAVGLLLEQVVALVPWGAAAPEAARRARVILDEMYQFVGLLDVDGNLLEANETALAAGGIAREAVIGRPFWEAHWWSAAPETQARLRAAVAQAAAGEFVRYEVDVFGAAGGAELVTIDFSLKPVRDRAGRVVFLLPEGRNITEKKRAEVEVARKDEELRRLRDRLDELERVKGQLLANVSHELRTPLALVLGSTRKLLAAEGQEAEARRDLEAIERSARTLLKHVNDLLDVARLQAGGMPSHPMAVDLAGLVRRTAALFEGAARERGVDLGVTGPESLLAAVDPDHLERVVLSLVSNALKFAPAGGRVRVELRGRGARVTLVVADNGPGVRAGMRAAIFEPFRRGEDQTSRCVGGTGLGLAIARGLVGLHGGTLQVREAPGGGALFRVDLPDAANVRPTHVAAAAARNGASRETREDLAGATVAGLERQEPLEVPGRSKAPGLVLVVEDDPEMRRFVADVLAADHQVVTAADAHDGMEKARTLAPDVIVSDVGMPELGGVPLVLLTARVDDELRARVASLLAVKRARDVLQREVASRDPDLVALAEELGRRQRELAAAHCAKDEFLAVLSHELRTPISAVLAWMWMLRRGQLDEPAAARALETMETDLRALVRMIDDLLDVSRIVRGTLRLDPRPIEVCPVVAAAVDAMRAAAEARHVGLATALDREAGLVLGDPARLQQVVWNLLANAIKFTPPGGAVRVTVTRSDGTVRVSVADTGVGISRSFLPHVFERFRQADIGLTRASGGLGLGLAIVRHLAELHGGTVEAESPGEDQGATFTVTLPGVAAGGAVEAPAETAEVAGGSVLAGVRVLVVDDEASTQELLVLLLTRAGASVQAAGSAAEAFPLVTAWRPDAIVSDVAMPGEDGHALLARVRALPADAGGGTPALALTAYARDEDREHALAAGFQQHLAKPFDPPALVAAVAALVPRRPPRSAPSPPVLVGMAGGGGSADDARTGRGRTILLVEDDPGTREYGCGVLEPLGYHVIPARTAREALQLWHAHRDEIDLVLTDLVVPRGSGMDVCRVVHAERADVPVIMISGYPQVAEMLGAHRQGVFECLQKPVEPEQLAATVGRALRLGPGR